MTSYKCLVFVVLVSQAACWFGLAFIWWRYFFEDLETSLSDIERDYRKCLRTSIESDTAVEFPVVTSPGSGRRFIAGVVTMRETAHSKLEPFKRAWNKAWPELDFKYGVGFKNSHIVQGMGCMASIYRLCVDALRTSQDFDYLILFEDDGKPHNNTSWPRDLDRVLGLLEEADGSGLLLGAHNITGYDKHALRAKVHANGLTITKARGGIGTYAMVVPKKYLGQLACRYERALSKKKATALVPDKENWFLWNHLAGGGFVAAPLLVDHRKHGYSYTWRRSRKFEMQRDFWNENDTEKIPRT